MAVRDFDWMGDKLGSATKNLRAKRPKEEKALE